MGKVKCRFCGKEIDRENAVCMKHGKANWYYCNLEHANSKKPRDQMFELLQEIFGETTNSVFFNEFDRIAKVHGHKKIMSYANENKEYLTRLMERNYSSDYGRIKYFLAIFKNNLGDYHISNEEVRKEVDIEVYIPKKKVNKRRKGMDEIMKGILSD